ncbi:MAG TPA: LCP family protein [Acidimicrobiales bacterium]|nr:LCP family protein [Acidimicrobiales bacterium]
MARSRSERRQARRKERKRRHRWRRRALYALAFVVLLAALGAGSIYVYATYRFDQIKKVHAKHLVATAPVSDQQPFTMLLVGSDSRAFVDNSTQANAFGTEADAAGQRSDVTMVIRFDPAAKTVTVLSIPRDLWVDIPGDEPGISGMNRINAAFNSGPDLLIQTIEQDLGIPINHYMSVDFPGFSGMVNALGGITMDFPTEVKDAYSGLDVTTTGCQVVNGTTALALVRSRHLYYMDADGTWQYDGQSDFSRIQRQDAFFRAVLARLNGISLNPFTVNSFIGAAVGNLTIDDTFTKSDMFNLAEDFRGLSSSHLITETLPTTAFTTSGGADVLQEAQPYAQQMIESFNQIGSATTSTANPSEPAGGGHSAAPTTIPTEAHGQVDVDVLNASTVDGIAGSTATALSAQGFTVTGIGDAPTSLSSAGPSQILYGPVGSEAAATLASVLSGPVSLVPDSSLSGQDVTLLIAGPQLTVTGTGSSGSATASTTGSTTTTTIPADVYTNTQPEPWNPYPCTLGQSAAPASATSSTVKGQSVPKGTASARSKR